MMIVTLALKNLYGAGLRTLLNGVALSFSFVAIIFLQGVYNGMNEQVTNATLDAQCGGGQYWQETYDPYDPLSLDDARALVPPVLQELIQKNKAVPVLIRQAAIYPNGRFQNALLKGIRPDQTVLSIPTASLAGDPPFIPALIGTRMAKSTGLAVGDFVTVRWRDVNGTFDADEVKIVEIMKTDVPDIDNSQLWIPIDRLRQVTAMPGEATMIVLEKGSEFDRPVNGWRHKDLDFLLQDVKALFLTKSAGGSIFYLVLLFLAMLAIFDTQVLSIFRRKKEMGTLMALGMTRSDLIRLFTLEGALHAVLAAVAAAAYGAPLMFYAASVGYGLPASTDNYGIAIGSRLFPVFSARLVIGTICLVSLVTTIVSYLPAKKISTLHPTDALRGKLT